MCLYLAVVEHADNVVSTALLYKLHLGNDSWVRAGKPATQHLSANGSHDSLDVGSSGTRRKVACNNSPASGLGSATDADATCTFGLGGLVVGSVGRWLRAELLVQAVAALEAGRRLSTRELCETGCTRVVHMVKVVAPASVVDVWLRDSGVLSHKVEGLAIFGLGCRAIPQRTLVTPMRLARLPPAAPLRLLLLLFWAAAPGALFLRPEPKISFARASLFCCWRPLRWWVVSFEGKDRRRKRARTALNNGVKGDGLVLGRRHCCNCA